MFYDGPHQQQQSVNLCKRGFCILAVGVAAASIFDGDEYTQNMSTTALIARSLARPRGVLSA